MLIDKIWNTQPLALVSVRVMRMLIEALCVLDKLGPPRGDDSIPQIQARYLARNLRSLLVKASLCPWDYGLSDGWRSKRAALLRRARETLHQIRKRDRRP
jgi:hypothetical protein